LFHLPAPHYHDVTEILIKKNHAIISGATAMKNGTTSSSGEDSQQSQRRRIADLLDRSSHEKSRPKDSEGSDVQELAELEEEEEEIEEAEIPEDEEEHEDRPWDQVNLELEKFMKSESGRAGVVLTVFALIGLLIVFATPWFSEEGGGGESYKYGDFGESVEDDFGRDFNDYYFKSAKLGLYSLLFFLIGGIALLIHSRTDVLVNILNASLGREGLGNDGNERIALRLITATIFLIPATLIAVVGSRFVGFVMLSSKGHISGESLASRPDGSAAGVGLLIIGILLIMLIISYIYETLPEFMKLIQHDKKTYDYLRSCQHFAEIVFLLSLVALVTLPMMSTLEISIERGSSGNTYTDDIYLSDGFTGVELYDEKGGFNKIHDDFQFMKFMLNMMIFVSVLSFIGTLLFPFRQSEIQNILISFIILALLAALLVLLMYFLIFGHGGNLEDDLTDSASVNDAQVEFSYNFIPVLLSLGVLGVSSKYIFEIYNTSLRPFLQQ